MTPDENKTKAQLIVELKHAREELVKIKTSCKCSQLKDDKFRLLTEISVTGIFIIQDAKMAYVNPSLAHMLGYKPEEIVGKLTLMDIVHSDDLPIVKQRFQERLDGKIEDRNVIYRAIKKNGTLVYVEVYGVRTEFQGSQAVMGTVIDVTERKKTEDALQESESKFRSIAENAVDCIFIKDKTRRYTFVNKAMKDLLGVPGSDILGKTPEEVFGQEQGRIIKEVDDRTFSGESVNETRNVVIGGRSFFFNTIQTQLVTTHDEVISIMGIVRDVTECKRSEEQILTEKKFTDTALDAQMDTFFLFEQSTGKALRWNRIFREISGYTDEEIISMPALASYYSQEDTKRVETFIQNLLKEGDGTIELELICKDGRKIPTEYRVLIVNNGQEKPKYIISIGRDISEHKQTKEALQESLKFKDKLISEVPVGISIYDAESGQCVAGNKTIAKLVGATEEQVLEQNFNTIESWKTSGLLETSKSALKENSKKEIEVNVTTTFGKEISFHCYFVPFLTGGKKYLLFTLNDFTERKQLESKLRHSERMLAIGQLAGGIAHDFNNVLAGIIGYADMALDVVSSNDLLSRYMKNILKAGERAKNLVSQVLTFSRQGREEKVSTNLSPVVNEVIELLKASIPSSIHLSVDIAKDTCPVMADTTKVHEMVMNLSTNAVHAMDEKGILTITLREDKTNELQQGIMGRIKRGFYSIIEVKDTGIGMAESVISHAFEPFYTTNKSGEGTGLGLSVVYGVMQSHNGNIQVESIVDEGTTFRLFFPKTEQEKLAEDEPRQEAREGHERILFVDDEELINEMGTYLLASLGYKVTSTTDSKEALRLFKENTKAFDLIITDQTMPNMTGLELTQEILKINPGFPVILCTGFSTKVNEKNAANAGVKHLFYKPITKKELAAKIREVFDS